MVDVEYEKEFLTLVATERIAEMMQLRGVSKADLARRLEVSRTYIGQLMKGDSNVSVEQLARIAAVLGFRLDISYRPLPPTGDTQDR